MTYSNTLPKGFCRLWSPDYINDTENCIPTETGETIKVVEIYHRLKYTVSYKVPGDKCSNLERRLRGEETSEISNLFGSKMETFKLRQAHISPKSAELSPIISYTIAPQSVFNSSQASNPLDAGEFSGHCFYCLVNYWQYQCFMLNKKKCKLNLWVILPTECSTFPHEKRSYRPAKNL